MRIKRSSIMGAGGSTNHGTYAIIPAKNNTNPAKTPLFPRLLSNSRLKYGKYICVRLRQNSSKITTFWSLASLTAKF